MSMYAHVYDQGVKHTWDKKYNAARSAVVDVDDSLTLQMMVDVRQRGNVFKKRLIIIKIQITRVVSHVE
jgi:hypothetical protein